MSFEDNIFGDILFSCLIIIPCA